MEGIAANDQAEALSIEAEHYANPEKQELVEIMDPEEPGDEEDIQTDENDESSEPTDYEEVEIDAFENEDAEISVDEDFTPRKGCWSGIDRWRSSYNSKNTYEAHKNSGGLWMDPSFGADYTSLSWA